MKKLILLAVLAVLVSANNSFAARAEMGDNTQKFEMGQGAEINATGLEASGGVDVDVKAVSVGVAAAQAGGIHINENINSGKMGKNVQEMKMGAQSKLTGSSVNINKNVNAN